MRAYGRGDAGRCCGAGKTVRGSKRHELQELFAANRRLFKAYVLREQLDRLWTYKTRPDVLNSLTFEVYAELERLALDCQGDESVRVLVLTGTGKGFCSGGDVHEIIGELFKRGSSIGHACAMDCMPLAR